MPRKPSDPKRRPNAEDGTLDAPHLRPYVPVRTHGGMKWDNTVVDVSKIDDLRALANKDEGGGTFRTGNWMFPLPMPRKKGSGNAGKKAK